MKKTKFLIVPLNVLMVFGLLAVSGCVSSKSDLNEARENFERLERANRNND